MDRITADMIADKEFSIESKGYNKDEVDTFLDEICEEMDRLNNEIFDLRQKTTIVRPAAAQPAPAEGGEENRFRKAREDAEAIRMKAETEAREQLDGLSAEKESLEQEVKNLKKVAAVYRSQFEELLRAQQEALEKAEGLF